MKEVADHEADADGHCPGGEGSNAERNGVGQERGRQDPHLGKVIDRPPRRQRPDEKRRLRRKQPRTGNAGAESEVLGEQRRRKNDDETPHRVEDSPPGNDFHRRRQGEVFPEHGGHRATIPGDRRRHKKAARTQSVARRETSSGAPPYRLSDIVIRTGRISTHAET